MSDSTSDGVSNCITYENRTRPSAIAHWGLRATPQNYDKVVKWHMNFWGSQIIHQTDRLTFLAYDQDEHHRLVIQKVPGDDVRVPDPLSAVGIYHIAFTYPTTEDLAQSYEEKKLRGILPHWPINHGTSTSMYYHDPDGNEFEMKVDNFETAEEGRAFMSTAEYESNPVGVDINVEEWIKKVRSGVPEAEIKKRPDIGPRPNRLVNSLYFSPENPLGTLYHSSRAV